ncbi:MAG TPA: hypothetical protein DCP28_18660 [Cytophagales bacterium]|nr:hypothetical protein [Cytophagales bacterium]
MTFVNKRELLFLVFWLPGWGCSAQAGLSLYLAKEYQRTEPHASQYFLPDEVSGEVVLEAESFLRYDSKSRTVFLADSAKHVLEQLQVPMTGLPVVLALDGKPLVGIWLLDGPVMWGNSWWVAHQTRQGLRLQAGMPQRSFEATLEDGQWERRLEAYFNR